MKSLAVLKCNKRCVCKSSVREYKEPPCNGVIGSQSRAMCMKKATGDVDAGHDSMFASCLYAGDINSDLFPRPCRAIYHKEVYKRSLVARISAGWPIVLAKEKRGDATACQFLLRIQIRVL